MHKNDDFRYFPDIVLIGYLLQVKELWSDISVTIWHTKIIFFIFSFALFFSTDIVYGRQTLICLEFACLVGHTV